jgi:hypothetical protein
MTIILSGQTVPTTALDLIRRAMRLAQALGQGEVPTAAEASDGLDALNTMLDSWRLDRNLIHRIQEHTVTWTAGQRSRTIGSGGNFDVARPVRLEAGFSRISNNDYPYRIVPREVYESTTAKYPTSSFPDILYYEEAYPLGTLWAYPIPNTNLEMHLFSWETIQAFTALTDTVQLPPGYKRAIEYNLALELADFATDLPKTVVMIAERSLAALKRINAPQNVSAYDIPGVVRERSDIFRG